MDKIECKNTKNAKDIVAAIKKVEDDVSIFLWLFDWYITFYF